MKLFYIGVIRNIDKPAFELASARNLADFSRWTKGSYDEFMTMMSKTVAERTRPGQRQDVEEQNNTMHVYARSEGCAGVIISDHEYPKMVAHQLLSKVLDEFITTYPASSWSSGNQKIPFEPTLQRYLNQYQDPKNADSIMKIQRELDETKITLHKTIESVLERGENLDKLVAKSDGLSMQSKMFYTSAKKQNSCCAIM